MTKKKMDCRYELLCLLNERKKNEEKYKRLIENMEVLLGKENIEKIEEKDWKPAFKINKLKDEFYILINFISKRTKAKELEKNVLQATSKDFLNRYLLLNLEDEKNLKIKLTKKLTNFK
jgi:ribosomal protein S6